MACVKSPSRVEGRERTFRFERERDEVEAAAAAAAAAAAGGAGGDYRKTFVHAKLSVLLYLNR